jgi:hypothetical protein
MNTPKNINQQLKEEKEIVEKNEEHLYYKKEYELYTNGKKYKLLINMSNKEVFFTLDILSEISCYNYINKCLYINLVKDLDLTLEINDNINKVFEYLELIIAKNDYKIIDDNKNKRLIINNKELISLKENLLYNHDIIKTLIDEIKIIKDSNNRLVKLNEEKDNIIENLEFKYKSLKEDLNNIIKNNDLIIRKKINLIYQSENESTQQIFGDQFVSENKNNIELVINGKETKLTGKYNLKKGENHIKIRLKYKIYNLSNMFNNCSSLKNIDDLKYLNTNFCNNFSYVFKGCSSISDLKALEKWNVSNGNNFSNMFNYFEIFPLLNI